MAQSAEERAAAKAEAEAKAAAEKEQQAAEKAQDAAQRAAQAGAAVKLDETVPGGKYKNAQGQMVNAMGEPLGRAKSAE